MPDPQMSNHTVIPADLWDALQTNPQLQATWERLSVAHQREYIAWIVGTKIAATRARRIEKALLMIEQWRREHPERVVEPA